MPAKYVTINARPASLEGLKELAAYWSELAGQKVKLLDALDEVIIRALDDIADRESMPAAQRARLDSIIKRLEGR